MSRATELLHLCEMIHPFHTLPRKPHKVRFKELAKSLAVASLRAKGKTGAARVRAITNTLARRALASELKSNSYSTVKKKRKNVYLTTPV